MTKYSYPEMKCPLCEDILVAMDEDNWIDKKNFLKYKEHLMSLKHK